MRKDALAAGTIAAGMVLGAVVWLTATPAVLADG
jgi:hypothetical protein